MSQTGTIKKSRRTVSQRRSNSNILVRKVDIAGHKFTPASNPPDVTYQPWYNVTIVYPFSGQAEITVNSLAGKLREQLDPTHRGLNIRDTGDSRFIVQLRIDSFSCWNLTSGSRMIALSVEDFHDTRSSSQGRDQLCGIIDTGGSGIAPKAGYRLPFSHRQAVLRNDDIEGGIYLANLAVADSESGIAHIKVLFRFDGPSKVPTFFPNHLSDIARSTKKIARGMADTIHVPLIGKASYVAPILPATTYNVALTNSALGTEDSIDIDDEASSHERGKDDEFTHHECPNKDPSTTDIITRLTNLEQLMSGLGITAPNPKEEGSQASDFSLMEETN